jgi:hypothetical protein
VRKSRGKYLFVAWLSLFLANCRKPYEPPPIKSSNHYVSVDGFINTSPFGVTTITLTRSLNLTDTIPILPELNAQVTIKSSNGATFLLVDTGFNGVYVSGLLNLDPSLQYQLSVTTSDGNIYASDLVNSKPAPPIDSVTWGLVDDANLGTQALNIYVNAHDETGKTQYYRWDYVETWQHESPMQTYWGVKDSLAYPIDPSESTFDCWTTAHSTSIILGSSINLSSDVISHGLITSFAKNDPKLDIKYSMLLRQYPLDFESYKYWLTIQKNSQSLGGLFDIQPSQIDGNFHSITNPKDPAFGYISACSVQEYRMFVSNSSLPGWKSNPPEECPVKIIPSNPDNYLIWDYPDTAFQLWYFVSNLPAPPTLKITHKDCLDCRFQGGSNIKPSFWP